MLKRFFQLMAVVRGRLFPFVSSRPKWRIIIPTRDGADRLKLIIPAYKMLGVEPLFAVDSRTSDNTLDVLKAADCLYGVCEVAGAGFLEGGMLSAASDLSDADWILRLDDDELPSRALIQFMDGIGDSKHAAFHISTRECFFRAGEVYYSRAAFRYWTPTLQDYLNPHLRIYRKSCTSFEEAVHTGGMKIDGTQGYAPSEAFHVHLSSLIRSLDQRVRKIRSYEAITKGGGWIHADEYLPELADFAAHAAAQDGLEEFRDVLGKLKPGSIRCDLTPDDLQMLRSEMNRKFDLYWAIRGLDAATARDSAAYMRVGDLAIQAIPQPPRPRADTPGGS